MGIRKDKIFLIRKNYEINISAASPKNSGCLLNHRKQPFLNTKKRALRLRVKVPTVGLEPTHP